LQLCIAQLSWLGGPRGLSLLVQPLDHSNQTQNNPYLINQVDWPTGLISDDLRATGSHTTQDSAPSQPGARAGPRRSRLRQLLGVGSLGLASAGSGWLPARPAGPLATLPSFSGSGSESHDEHMGGEDGSLKARSLSSSGLFGGPRGGSDPGDRSGRGGGGGAQRGAGAFRRDGGQRQARGDASGGAFMKLLMRQGSDSTSQDSVFYGLRVRMGVATGKLPFGDDITRSAVFDLAKGESRRERTCNSIFIPH
jgi:hypothetical protein